MAVRAARRGRGCLQPAFTRSSTLSHTGTAPPAHGWRHGLTRMALLAPFLLTCSSTGAMESWSDDRLSVVAGLQLWFDASHQNAGRTELQLAPLGSGNAVDYLLDGTGHQRHLVQSHRERRPSFRQEFNGAYLSFDGKDDCLSASLAGLSLTNLTLFLVTAPATNEGDFRAFCALNRAGHNDYLSGLNLDLGPVATPQFLVVNAEGNGFGGASQLWRGHGAPFRGWHTLALECQSGPGGVRLFVDGRAQGSRDRQDSVLRADEFVLGARHYSNTGEPPYTQGFLKGDIAEVLLFDRLLSEKERATVQEYLSRKYGLLLGRPPGALDDSKPLVSVTNPPPVQMLLPGFAVRELPLSLKNINNVKYRGDGKLVALGYDGRIDLLADTDGDGLEDRAEPFWTNPANAIRSPIGMALTPAGYSRGQGAFVAAKGRLSLIVDTNGDDRADEEVIVAEGWKELAHGVDALGVAIDRGGNVFFGLGTASFTEAYLVDKTTGQSRYDLKSERGTILKVSPDFKTREIVCTGIRFPVALAFNQLGDLFCTDQEGATWLPNGNPFDELLHIQTGRHYGFPPRHPRYLPKVVDEPSVFDYAPQHQSTCGLTFNQSVNGGPVFGPAAWTGDALVCGYSRGKIWRTKLVKTAAGYVAQSQLIASLPTLAVDAGVSPRGDLIVATHSGDPDWGSGPNGLGHLYRIRYADRAIPQPVLAWPGGPAELRVALDRPVDPLTLKDLAKHTEITQGQIVVAGERFEVKRPGYAVVYSQMGLPRYDIAVEGIAVTPDLRTLILKTRPIDAAAPLAVTFHDLGKSWGEVGGDDQVPDVDLVVDLNGLSAHWESTGVPANAEPPREAASDLWLPHLDLDVARALTRTSADHDRFWEMLQHPGTLRLRTQLDLWQMLQPAVQPGSKLDYERPVEQVSVAFEANTPFTLRSQDTALSSQPAADGKHRLVWPHRGQSSWIPVEVSFKTGQVQPQFGLTWSTADDSRWRPFPLRRLVVPWARQQSSATGTSPERAMPELAGGRWLRGKHIFFDETVACFKCHRIRGEGSTVGPDLSNLVHRDYASVFRDITQPNAALNPDHLAYAIELTDGEELSAVVKEEMRSGSWSRMPRSCGSAAKSDQSHPAIRPLPDARGF
ncbi:MAG: hypothetical protein U1G07_25645 [Verrucomicrobiota bacterium]